jgi:hypothetical protein
VGLAVLVLMLIFWFNFDTIKIWILSIEHCGFESTDWFGGVYDVGSVNIIANDDVTINDDKHSISKNPWTGLHYRLHILNVGVSDLKQYRCEGLVNDVSRIFYLMLDLLGSCNYMLVIFKVENKALFQLAMELTGRYVTFSLFLESPYHQRHCELMLYPISYKLIWSNRKPH